MASSKVQKGGSFGSKRSRSDVPRRDGDWTCSQCGNMNFSFRSVCNRGACGAPRPSSSPSPRLGPAPVPGSYNRLSPFHYGGVGTPPPLPLGMPSSYAGPFSQFGFRYYGLPTGVPGPYGFFSAYGEPRLMGGMSYGADPVMEPYGYGFRGSPMPTSSPLSGGGLTDNSALRKRRGGPDGLSEGDWICPNCENVNFAFRTTCNRKNCGTARPALPPNHGSSGNRDAADAPEGSWTCSKCGNLNYPFRTVCNWKGCGNERPSDAS